MVIQELNEFKKGLKKLSKKHKTLFEDIKIVKKILEVKPEERPPFSYKIDGLGLDTCVIIKIKKIASKSFKGKGVQSGFRVMYAHFEEEEKIILIEIYHKSVKKNEDKERILRNFR
jgi:mRNA-degrading endonuclease RelE of RelBE toxin-antitoxin system